MCLVAFGIMRQRYSASPFSLTGRKELQGEFADKILHHQPPNRQQQHLNSGAINAMNVLRGLFPYFLKHQLHLQVFHGKKESNPRDQFMVHTKKRQPEATKNLLQLFLQTERKKCVFMFLCLWRGRKVNYAHWKKKKCCVKVQRVPLGTLIHQQLPNHKCW